MSPSTNDTTAGRGWFRTGTILVLLTAVAHTLGQFGPQPPVFDEAEAAMRAARLDMGLGMMPSLLDILSDLSFSMSITYAALGALNLLFGWSRDVSPGLRRKAALVNLLWVGAAAGLSYYYRIPPPMICALVTWPLFLMAYLRSRA